MARLYVLTGLLFFLFIGGFIGGGFFPGSVRAQSGLVAENHFRSLFTTAGYSTAFGAALGAAAIGLTENPGNKLRYVAVGGSLGFITGSLMGTWLIFNPMVSYDGRYHSMSMPDLPEGSLLALEPMLSAGSAPGRGGGGLRLRWQWTLGGGS